jgi:hypothetical protein
MDQIDSARNRKFKWLRRERTRGGLGFLAFAGSLFVSTLTNVHPTAAIVIVLVAIIWNVFLFWPEISSLKIVYSERARTESPVWLYIFALASLGAFVCIVILTYYNITESPRRLSAGEFANSNLVGKRLYITDLVDSENVIEGRTFEDCWIYGPAVLSMVGGDMMKNTFEGTSAGTFVTVSAGMAGNGTGIVLLKDCRFRRCKFINVSIAGNAALVTQWKENNTGAGTNHPNERAAGTP